MTVDWGAVSAQVENRPHEVARREYEYVSLDGEPLHRTMRVDRSDGSKVVWQQRFEDGWTNGLGDVQTVLYRLPGVIEWRARPPRRGREGRRGARGARVGGDHEPQGRGAKACR